MSKFALRALADSLRHELARDGVSVTLVNPGFVESEIYQVDNRGVRRTDVKSPVPSWLRMPAPRAARQIARAVQRRRSEVGVTRHGQLAIFLQRHAPRLLSGAIRLVGITARREPGR